MVFRDKARQSNLDQFIEVDSAGTGSWHVDHSPDTRAIQAAKDRNYDMSLLRARQVSPTDIDHFDYIYAMDKQNFYELLEKSAPDDRKKISLFLSHGSNDIEEVPDPYYNGAEGFEQALDLIENASEHLLRKLAEKHQWL